MTKKQTFEVDMARLEELVTTLEESELGLEESLEAFEEGMKIVKKLTGVLDKAQERVLVLSKDEEGQMSLDGFDDVEEER